MHGCNNHTQGSSKAHQTKVMGWIMSSLISTIHFGGLWFTPYQHPSSIDIKDTQERINHESRVCCKSRAWSLGSEPPKGSVLGFKPAKHVLQEVPIVIIPSFGYYRKNDYSFSKNILKRDSYECSIA